MTLTVTLTGTGNPVPNKNRAGGGVLVQVDDLNLQFDAGRATSMRLAAVGVHPSDLHATFLTHHHSDHLQGLDDLAFTRQIGSQALNKSGGFPPFNVYALDGPLRYFLEHLLDPWKSDFEVRQRHRGDTFAPTVDANYFEATSTPMVIWQQDDVQVFASTVQHDPVRPAVAYRVDSPAGSVVISGDTSVCDEVLNLAKGADVLVHEAMLTAVTQQRNPGVVAYHSDTQELGELAKRAGVNTLVLTHLIPAPESVPGGIEAGVKMYEDQARQGGFTGELHVGEDLLSVSV